MPPASSSPRTGHGRPCDAASVALLTTLAAGEPAATLLHRLLSALLEPDDPATTIVAANSIAQEAVGGRTDWTSIANAAGDADGSVASVSGDALGSRGGLVRCDFPNFVPGGAITSVTVAFYGQKVAGATGDLSLGWRVEGATADATLDTFTGLTGDNFLTTPKTYDLTSARSWSWTDLNNFDAFFRWSSTAGQLGTGQADAVVLTVTSL